MESSEFEMWEMPRIFGFKTLACRTNCLTTGSSLKRLIWDNSFFQNTHDQFIGNKIPQNLENNFLFRTFGWASFRYGLLFVMGFFSNSRGGLLLEIKPIGLLFEVLRYIIYENRYDLFNVPCTDNFFLETAAHFLKETACRQSRKNYTVKSAYFKNALADV